MRRRQALKAIPLTIAGLSGLTKTTFAVPERANSETPLAQIKEHHGTPTLYLEREPTFFSSLLVGKCTPEEWERSHWARLTATKTGTHIYYISAFGACGKEWSAPRPGEPDRFDFDDVEPLLKTILKSDPKAHFQLLVRLEITNGDWFQRLYPQECEVISLGPQPYQSYASQIWRKRANEFLKAFIAHIHKIGLSRRIFSYIIGAGHTGEWVKKESAMASPCGDFSEPMRLHFQAFLRERYYDDLQILRAAWNNPQVTFETCKVPSQEEQARANYFTFRDPRSEQNVIDYYQCLAELCADLIIEFCRTVKDATSGNALAGAYYGYLMDLAWNAGFFGEWRDRWQESEFSTYQRSGHLGLKKVLESPYVDLLASPYSYGFRHIGGVAPSHIPAESIRLHGKLGMIENDTRLHYSPRESAFGRANNQSESVTLLRRNFIHFVTHGQGDWFTELKDERLFPEIKKLQALGRFALKLDRSLYSDIAVLIDDESFYYESIRNNLDVPLIFQQHLHGLPRLGAPFDVFLLDDFINNRLPPHKLDIFLNCFRLDKTRRAALRSQILKQPCTTLWLYAPGCIDDDLSLESMTELTNFRFGMIKQPWGPYMHVTDFLHVITADLQQDLFWGTDNLLSPVFYLDDPDALILGTVVGAQGQCLPGMGLKTLSHWNSIFVSVPNLPASLLRGIVKFAGAHIFSDAGDVLQVTHQLLGVHTVSGGERVFKLPTTVETIYDLFDDKLVAQSTDRFRVELAPASTMLFYFGDSKALLELKS